jgi:glycosyltransferase involved in cell wall biosynthesis
MKPRVLFIHYHIGERDGVGLEIEKRANLMMKLGAKVYYLTGDDKNKGKNGKRTYMVKELHPKKTLISFMREFGFYRRMFNESTMISLHFQLESKIYKKMQRALEEIKPDLIFVHNLFSFPWNLAATTALVKLLDKYQVPTVAVHHDFWFDRKQYMKPSYHFIRETLDSLPPNRPYIIKHQVINSLDKKKLLRLRKIKAERIGDYFDYRRPIPQADDYNRDMRRKLGIRKDDLLILHATRIHKRKGIENAVVFARELGRQLKKQGKVRINGREIGGKSRAVLLFSNYVEFDELEYFKKVKKLADMVGLKVIWGWDWFSVKRDQMNGEKRYSFWDSYVQADLVTYTSLWEGFGNQFLEAVFFKKLIVLFEYPVFKTDLKEEGYKYVSLGSDFRKKSGLRLVGKEKVEAAAQKALEILVDEERLGRVVNENFAIAKKNHGLDKLEKDMRELLARAKKDDSYED